MRDAILNFSKQFAYEPVIENADKLPRKNSFIVIGMGGSHLNADLLHAVDPACDVVSHRDYGLPEVSEKKLRDSIIILSSYSGNTEEVLDAYDESKKKKLDRAVIAVGGTLIDMAKADGIPHVQLPNTGIQPRSALGLSAMALFKLVGKNDLIHDMHALAERIDPSAIESQGKKLADELSGHVPVIYSSRRNETIAWNWKIKLNETGKIPAFYNVFPELNHNEMTGFDVKDATKDLSAQFFFIMLRDSDDHPQVQKRMEVCAQLYRDRGLQVRMIDLKGKSHLEKIFSSLMLADWTSVYTAEQYELESEQVPMVEEFKRLIIV